MYIMMYASKVFCAMTHVSKKSFFMKGTDYAIIAFVPYNVMLYGT